MAVNDWKIAWYDAAAEPYDRVALPHVFTQPAKDLVALLKLPPKARVLDIGAGTGITALLASKCLGPRALVVAPDSSIGMLRLARKKGLRRLVVGVVPGLPFPDAVLDGALATFVLSHIPCYQAALSDMVRVLRPGGRLAATAWGPSQSEFRQLWQATAESFVSKEQLSRGLREALPSEDWFSDAGHLEEALREAGVRAHRGAPPGDELPDRGRFPLAERSDNSGEAHEGGAGNRAVGILSAAGGE
jgi:ubiquinone/menaquinone biosynthesis C-methylase UbiE